MLKNVLFSLTILLISIDAFSKTIEVFNNTEISMDFWSSGWCVKQVPSSFRLKMGESKKIDINLDKTVNCPPGQQTPVYDLYAKATDPSFQANFSYLTEFMDHDISGSGYTCKKMKDNNYFCYYVPDYYHPAIKLEYDQNYIYVLDPTRKS
jgi:hypothetical protein